MVSLYSGKIVRAFEIVEKHEKYGEIAKLKMARALRLGNFIEEAIVILNRVKIEYEEEKNDELAECYFHQRNFKSLKELINNIKSQDDYEDSNIKEWILIQNPQSAGEKNG